MKTIKNISNLFRVLAVGLVFTAASCTTQDDFVKPTETPSVPAASAATEATSVASLTVTGEFTEFRDQNECSTCSYVVPEDATVVDGAKLGIKPGSVICLNKAFKYNAVEFVNVTGTSENPVIIANCGE